MNNLWKKWFSFVEIIISISILTIISIVATTAYNGMQQKSDNSKIIWDLRSLSNTLESFKEANKNLPQPSWNKSFYKENGYRTNEKTPSERLAMAQTPLLMYANFDMPNDNLGVVSPIYFSNLIFDYAGLNKSLFYQFLSGFYKEIPVLRDELKVDKNGEVINDLTKKQKEMLEQYKIVQNLFLFENFLEFLLMEESLQ